MDVVSIFTNAAIQNLSAAAVLVLVVLMILTGRLIPKSTHESQLSASNRRGDEWKETALETRTLNVELAKQNTTLTEANKTAAEFFGTVQKGGGNHVGQETNPGRTG